MESTCSEQLTWNDTKWRLDRPSIFSNKNTVKEFEGKVEIEALKNPHGTSYVYIYHPDCGYCKKSAPEWEKFASDFGSKYNQTNLKIGAINLSKTKNRKSANSTGQQGEPFLEAIGSIKTVPTIKLFKNGQEFK